MREKDDKRAQILDRGAITRAVNRISFEIIEKNYGSQNILLVGIRTRGEFLARRIANKIFEVEGIRVPVVSLDITPFRDDVDVDLRTKKLTFESNIADTTGLAVIIVDDVLFTGRSIRASIEAVLLMGRPKRIELAVLVDRGHREMPIRPDFVGKNIPASKNETVKVNLFECDGQDSVTVHKNN